MKMPEGKFISTVKVGEKGQIVIPKGAREIFDIQPGDNLLLLADVHQGIALVPNDEYLHFAEAIFHAQKKPSEPEGEEGGGKP